ncbi:LacI family DNA-binding transcriptional regulator [Streptomyces sp. LHD-70]|uniref:LacI family DNA-binding transcriptional regulator n=1 Tax=Streptomyces sp. LHD-70 TaxID=3072140 RepID=UPI00280E9651|nr:LacI family DNA-binding transcriptional regulator [Streptomyces sp. LHD-70]MDQ8705378.1 LacI family DNA-binding transcriptional regulator [Streptomyces sp. LHD-70]
MTPAGATVERRAACHALHVASHQRHLSAVGREGSTGCRSGRTSGRRPRSGSQADGIVLVPSARPKAREAFDVPVVEMMRASGRSRVDSVQCAEDDGSANLINHLRSLGHERIAVIAGDLQFSNARERVAAARAALGENGLPDCYVMAREHTPMWGAEALRRLMGLDPALTAVFASSGDLALGVLHEANRLGLDIPGQLSLVAFGNTDWFEICRPPVTAFAHPMHEIGMITAQVLLSRINGDSSAEPSRIRVEGRMILRESTAPPSS